MLDDVSARFETLHTKFEALPEAQAQAQAQADEVEAALEAGGEDAAEAVAAAPPVANPRVVWWSVDAKNDLCDRISSLHDRMANGHVTVGSNGAEPVLFSPRPSAQSIRRMRSASKTANSLPPHGGCSGERIGRNSGSESFWRYRCIRSCSSPTSRFEDRRIASKAL